MFLKNSSFLIKSLFVCCSVIVHFLPNVSRLILRLFVVWWLAWRVNRRQIEHCFWCKFLWLARLKIPTHQRILLNAHTLVTSSVSFGLFSGISCMQCLCGPSLETDLLCPHKTIDKLLGSWREWHKHYESSRTEVFDKSSFFCAAPAWPSLYTHTHTHALTHIVLNTHESDRARAPLHTLWHTYTHTLTHTHTRTRYIKMVLTLKIWLWINLNKHNNC